MTQVNVVETEIKPLTCKTSDTEYVSEGIDKKTIGRCCQGPFNELIPRAPRIPNRHRPRFFDQVGHQTTYAYFRNKHFSLNHVIVRPQIREQISGPEIS